MSSLVDLPTEIQLRIFEFCPPKALKSLRLAHRSLRPTTSSLLFRKCTLCICFYVHYDVFRPALESGPYRHNVDLRPPGHRVSKTQNIPAPRQLMLRQVLLLREDVYKSAGDRSELEFLYENVRELVITRYDLYGGYPEIFVMEKGGWPVYPGWSIAVLKNFMGKMRRLRVVDWDMPVSNLGETMTSPSLAANVTHLVSTCDTEKWYREVIPTPPLTGFETLVNITNLDILLSDPIELNGYKNLPNLTHLTLEHLDNDLNILTFLNSQTAPFQLRSLSLKNDISKLEFPREIFGTYLGSLSSLHLFTPEAELRRFNGKENPTSPFIDWSKKPIWTHLGEHGIYLREISVYGQPPGLLDYLQSYPSSLSSGLEVFNLKIWPYMTRRVQDPLEFLQKLWTQVIPVHCRTLRSLGVYPEVQLFSNGGNCAKTIMTWEQQHNMHQKLTSGSEERLCELTADVKAVLKTCERLDTLRLGSLDCKGVEESLKFVLFSMPRRLRDIGFHVNGWSAQPSYSNQPGSLSAGRTRELAGVRQPLLLLTWDSPITQPDDWAWKRLSFDLVPISQMWFVKCKTGRWRLMDTVLEDRVLRHHNGKLGIFQKVWGGKHQAVDDYDAEGMFEAARSNHRLSI